MKANLPIPIILLVWCVDKLSVSRSGARLLSYYYYLTRAGGKMGRYAGCCHHHLMAHVTRVTWLQNTAVLSWHVITFITIHGQSSVETNLFFERIRISNLIRNPENFRIRIRILFVVRKFSNPNPNIRDSGKKIRIRIRIWRNILINKIIE